MSIRIPLVLAVVLSAVPGTPAARDFPDARVGLGHIEMARGHYEAALRNFTVARDRLVDLYAEVYAKQWHDYWDAQITLLKLKDEIEGLRKLPSKAPLDATICDLEREIRWLELVDRSPGAEDPR